MLPRPFALWVCGVSWLRAFRFRRHRDEAVLAGDFVALFFQPLEDVILVAARFGLHVRHGRALGKHGGGFLGVAALA